MAKTFFKFNKLIPHQNINLSGYEEAIKSVFDNPDLKNIAISEAYDSRKNSLLESYKTKRTIYYRK